MIQVYFVWKLFSLWTIETEGIRFEGIRHYFLKLFTKYRFTKKKKGMKRWYTSLPMLWWKYVLLRCRQSGQTRRKTYRLGETWTHDHAFRGHLPYHWATGPYKEMFFVSDECVSILKNNPNKFTIYIFLREHILIVGNLFQISNISEHIRNGVVWKGFHNN